jgi:AbiV family abortive infection protein
VAGNPESAVPVVIANAQRLLADGELLFQHGRYGSAVSLAVLSLEECGKAYLLRSNRGSLLHHIDKQREAGLYLMTDVAIQALNDHRAKWIDERLAKLPPEAQTDMIRISLARAWADQLVTEPGRSVMRQCLVESWATAGTIDHVESIRAGKLNETKMLGFYVDIADGGVVSTPDSLTGEEARSLLDIATDALARFDDPPILLLLSDEP